MTHIKKKGGADSRNKDSNLQEHFVFKVNVVCGEPLNLDRNKVQAETG